MLSAFIKYRSSRKKRPKSRAVAPARARGFQAKLIFIKYPHIHDYLVWYIHIFFAGKIFTFYMKMGLTEKSAQRGLLMAPGQGVRRSESVRVCDVISHVKFCST